MTPQKPKRRNDSLICSTCSGLWVRAFASYGVSGSISTRCGNEPARSSMRIAPLMGGEPIRSDAGCARSLGLDLDLARKVAPRVQVGLDRVGQDRHIAHRP